MLAAVCACGDSEAVRVELASSVERVEPHRELVSRFDRWAHRVASAEAVWANRDALEETAFTPVRHEASVVAAWIRRGEATPLAHPRGMALPEVALRRVQVEGLGEVEVGETTLERRRETVPVVMIALERDGLRTILAFERDAPE